MLQTGPKVSLNVLILAVLVVGVGAFVAGWHFSGRDIGGGYISSPVNEEPVGIAIYVFDPIQGYQREALMRSMDDVLEAKHLLARRFLTRNTVWYGLDPDWRLQTVYVDDDALFYTPQEVSRILDRVIRTYVVYDVEYGDSLIEIAQLWGMELSELLRINDITEDTQLEPGQRLWVVTMERLFEIITIEEILLIEPLHRYVERTYVDTLAQGRTRVVQEGSDGEHIVEVKTTRRGFEVIDETITPREIIVVPVSMIVEIGQ